MSTRKQLWYYSINEVSYGPVSKATLLAMIGRGQLTPSSLVWRSDFGSEWRMISDLPELDTVVTLAAGAQSGSSPFAVPSSPGSLEAARGAWNWMKMVLFKKSGFIAWVSIALCFYLGDSKFIYENAVPLFSQNRDEISWPQDFATAVSGLTQQVAESAESATPHKSDAEQDSSQKTLVTENIFAKTLLMYVAWHNHFFTETSLFPLMAVLILVNLLFFFFVVKGRLMMLHRLHFPADPLRSAWRRSQGITRQLVYFYAILNMAFLGVFFFIVLRAIAQVAPETLASGRIGEICRAVCASESGAQLFLAASLTLGLIFLIRSFTYHFVEPIVYGRGVGVTAAFRAAWRFCRYNPTRIIGFFIMLGFAHCVFFLVISVISVAHGYLVTRFTFLLGASLFARTLILLPIYYFYRGLGPRLLGVFDR